MISPKKDSRSCFPSPGAQTERRGGAGPVRGLLGGKDLTGHFSFISRRAGQQARPNPSQLQQAVSARRTTGSRRLLPARPALSELGGYVESRSGLTAGQWVS